MTQNFAVPRGNIKLVIYDDRPNSSTKGQVQEIFMGEDNHCLVKVPPGVVNGFKGIGDQNAIVANCTDIPHDPEEITRIDPFTKDIPYNWDIKQG